MLVDTHCHIHEANYPLDIGDTLHRAREAGVGKLICVGTDDVTSGEAVQFSKRHENIWASLGVHPHEAEDGYQGVARLVHENHSEVVAIGEIGLDYFYTHSPRETQITVLEAQIQLALDRHLPIIFHVRDAFDDFWPIFDNFHGVRGELHSFTDNRSNLEKALERNLFIGVNGISTFTKDEASRATFDAIPLQNLLFETDAPFLTPAPHRGKVNEPAYVRVVAEHHAQRRNLSLQDIAAATTANANSLFAI